MSYYTAGQYKAVIKHVGLSESKEKHTPYVQLIVEPTAMIDVTNNETIAVERSYEREVMLWLTESTAERTCDDLRRIGFTGDAFEELVDGPARESLIGQEIQVRCDIEQYEGKDYEKWNLSGSVRSIVNQTKLDDQGARKLNAIFGKQLKASKLQQVNTPQPDRPKAAVDHNAAKAVTDANKALSEVEDGVDIPF